MPGASRTEEPRGSRAQAAPTSASHAVRAVRGRLPGPNQRGVRGTRDESRARTVERAVRIPVRHIFLRLLPVRDSEQSDIAPDRRPPVDRPHLADVGSGRVIDGIRQERARALRSPLSARSGRGGILSRDTLLSVVLVPSAATGSSDRLLPDGVAGCEHHRRAAVGLDPGPRARLRTLELAVAAA